MGGRTADVGMGSRRAKSYDVPAAHGDDTRRKVIAKSGKDRGTQSLHSSPSLVERDKIGKQFQEDLRIKEQFTLSIHSPYIPPLRPLYETLLPRMSSEQSNSRPNFQDDHNMTNIIKNLRIYSELRDVDYEEIRPVRRLRKLLKVR